MLEIITKAGLDGAAELALWVLGLSLAAVLLWWLLRATAAETKRLESLSEEELKDDGWLIR